MKNEHNLAGGGEGFVAPFSIVPKVAAAISIGIGIIIIIGWIFGIEPLKRGLPGYVAMNPATAIGFVLAGISFALLLRIDDSRAIRFVAKLLAVIVLLIGAGKLAGLALGWHPNLDEILFAAKLSHGGPTPNRMAPNTAANFILVGAALLSLNFSARRFSITQFFAILIFFGSLLPITGYAYGVTSFTGIASFIPMAIHTAVTFFILALGLFFAEPESAFARTFAAQDPRGVVARRLFPAAIFLTLVLGWMRLKGEERGLYETRFGTALFAVILCVLFLILALWTVVTVGKSEAERDAANLALLNSREDLQDSVRDLELIINHARELICTLDYEGRFLSVSAASSEILGHEANSLVGSTFSALHAPEERPKIEASLRDVISGMRTSTFQGHCRRRDNSFAVVAWSMRSSSHHQRIFCVGRDSGLGDKDFAPWQGA